MPIFGGSGGSLAPIASHALIGNATTATAVPAAVTLAATGGIGFVGGQLANVITYNEGPGIQIDAVSANDITISFAGIAASRLLGNAGTVSGVPGQISLGANLSINAGGTLLVSTGAGTGANLGAVANAGTIQIYNTITAIGTAAGTLTIVPTSGTSDVLITMPAGGGTVTAVGAPSFPRQRMLWDIKQGATAGVLNLGTVYNMTGAITSFTLTPTAGAVDQIGWISPNGTVWKPEFVNQGGTI